MAELNRSYVDLYIFYIRIKTYIYIYYLSLIYKMNDLLNLNHIKYYKNENNQIFNHPRSTNRPTSRK